MKATTSPGAINGSTTERNVRPQEAPLTVETSSSSTLICCNEAWVERHGHGDVFADERHDQNPHGGIDWNGHD